MEANSGRIRTFRSLDTVPMALIRQRWDQPDVRDIAAEVRAQLARCGALGRLKPGGTVAITAGSRGIASNPAVLRAVVQAVREAGGQPFIFPAMGSHGGGTAEGQQRLLVDLGVSEETMGAPVHATMDVVQIGQTDDGLPVYLDAIAAQADGIIVVNRVKKHTNFDGPIESGLCKMAVIGMGKHRQAVAVHQFGNPGLRRYVPEVARIVFEKAPVIAGLAILENAWGGLAELVGLAPEEIVDREPALFQRAKALSAKLPFREIDIALVERMGKEISGTGLDCYVIGRRRIIGEPEWEEAPRISSLVLGDITEASHGNGIGVGLADFTTRRLVDKIDWEITRTNIMTSGNLERGKVPLVFETEREAMEAAAFRERVRPLETLRIVCMRDTLHLRHLLVSSALADEARARPDLEVLREGLSLPYDAAGNWLSPFEGLS